MNKKLTGGIASTEKRVFAYILDIVLLLIATELFSNIFDWFPPLLTWIIIYVSCVMYFIYSHSKDGGGQTIGKRLFKIKVVSTSNKLITPKFSLRRSYYLIGVSFFQLFLMFAYPSFIENIGSIMLLLIAPDLLTMICRKDKRSIHDLIAGTKVITVNK